MAHPFNLECMNLQQARRILITGDPMKCHWTEVPIGSVITGGIYRSDDPPSPDVQPAFLMAEDRDFWEPRIHSTWAKVLSESALGTCPYGVFWQTLIIVDPTYGADEFDEAVRALEEFEPLEAPDVI